MRKIEFRDDLLLFFVSFFLTSVFFSIFPHKETVKKPLLFEIKEDKPLFPSADYGEPYISRKNGEMFVVVGPDFVVWADKEGQISASTTTRKPIKVLGENQRWIEISGNCITK